MTTRIATVFARHARFERVRDAFAENFRTRDEVGAALAVVFASYLRPALAFDLATRAWSCF